MVRSTSGAGMTVAIVLLGLAIQPDWPWSNTESKPDPGPQAGLALEQQASAHLLRSSKADLANDYVPAVTLPQYQVISPMVSIVDAAEARVRAEGGQITEQEARAALSLAGWEGTDLEEALAVFCGIGNRSGFASGESNCSPLATHAAGDSIGLAQLHAATWADHCGVTREALFGIVANLRCARFVFEYDRSRGSPRWKQWSVKP